MQTSTRDEYRRSRIYYILAAAVEYFISILVGSTYLAKLAGSIGIDDGTIGVITSFVSLGCGFQIFALFIRSDRPVKRLVTIANLANQLCFSFLYTIPLFNISSDVKTVAFILLLLSGHILMNIVSSPKVVWSRSLIDDSKRGSFCASCEIVSLVSGVIFTLIMGRVIDHFEAAGDLKSAFIICGITLFALTASNAALLLLMKEKKKEQKPNPPKTLSRLKDSLCDRATITLIPVFVLWNIALYITTPFFGTYQLNELGFSMTVISVLTMVYSLIRSLVSHPLGALGDKRSFVDMITVAHTAMLIGLVINSFGGVPCYIIYYILYAITFAGVNSGQMNLIFDYVAPEKRMGAVAILYTMGGFVGFLATLAAKPLVDHIQSSGNTFLFFDRIYAQQIMSMIGAAVLVLCILYTNTAVRRLSRPQKDPVSEP